MNAGIGTAVLITGNHPRLLGLNTFQRGDFPIEVVRMKMDVTQMTMKEVEELVARLERFSECSGLRLDGGRLELLVE